MLAVTCGGAAVVGHSWPIYLGMKGGKGVATGIGVVFAMNWMAGAIVFGFWLLIFLAFRYISLASVLAALPLPAVHHATASRFHDAWKTPWPFTIFLSLVTLLIVFRHRENLRRLRQGREPKFYFSKAGATSPAKANHG